VLATRRLVLAGENPYKAQAYARAAESLAVLSEPLGTVIAAGNRCELPDVGIALAETIRQLHWDGTTPRLEAMRAEVPTSVLELLAVPGQPPPRVVDLHRELGIASVAPHLQVERLAGGVFDIKRAADEPTRATVGTPRTTEPHGREIDERRQAAISPWAG
jgi:DNA polymerase/3'-5' exonuclease PolX